MAYTTINKSTDHFNTKLYSGTGSTNAITGVGFQPDWTWIKARDHAYGHHLQDAVRGTGKDLYSNLTDAEYSNANSLTTFGADGFTVGSDNGVNNGSKTYVSWNWLGANGTASNSNGSITSTVSANTTAGFSIVSYTGTGSAATIGHGLGSTPKIVLVKNRTDASTSWIFYTTAIDGSMDTLTLQNADAKSDSSTTVPTSSVFYVPASSPNVSASSKNYIAYCFAEKTGYSKFGSYTGNGNADGPFVYTGFKPNWVMIKETSGSGAWRIFDNKRPSYNEPYALMADVTSVEETSASRNKIDQLSNGFKLRFQYDDTNGSGGSYIYMAFGQSIVGSNNIAATAR